PNGVIAGTSPRSASRGPAHTPITSCLGAGPPVPRLLLNIANLLAGILWLGSFCRRCASWATAAEEKTRTPTINRKHGTGLIFIGYSLFFGWGHKLAVNLLSAEGTVERRAIGEDDLSQNPDLRASFGSIYVNRDNVPRRHRIPGPASKVKRIETASFSSPMLDVPLVILHVKHEESMRISPQDFSHHCLLQNDFFGHVVRCTPVMCEQQRDACCENPHNQAKTRYWPNFHGILLIRTKCYWPLFLLSSLASCQASRRRTPIATAPQR